MRFKTIFTGVCLVMLGTTSLSAFELTARSSLTGNGFVGKLSHALNDDFTLRYGGSYTTSPDEQSYDVILGLGFRKAPGGIINLDIKQTHPTAGQDITTIQVSKPVYYEVIEKKLYIGMSFTLVEYVAQSQAMTLLAGMKPSIKFVFHL